MKFLQNKFRHAHIFLFFRFFSRLFAFTAFFSSSVFVNLCIFEPAFCALPAKGSLVIIGGALRKDNAVVWGKIVQLAGGNGAKIAVIPAASSDPEGSGSRVLATFNAYGARAFLVPLSLSYHDEEGSPTYTRICHAPEWIKQIDQAQAVFFTGGDQNRIVQVLRNHDGSNTPLLDAIWRLYRRGGVIAGTSAGAAIMSTTMFKQTNDLLGTLQHGVHEGKEIGPGLGFIGEHIFVDQHFLIRGRFARMLPAMLAKSYQIGLGIDENTAMVVHQESEIEIVGYKGALLIDLSQAQKDPGLEHFNLRGVRLSFLSHGDKLHLHTKEVRASEDKEVVLQGTDDDGASAPRIYPDILGNTLILDMMSALIDSQQNTATGLAFNPIDTHQSEIGFEFTLSKTANTKAYASHNIGAELLTIVDMQLDVKPVQINFPLYHLLEGSK